MIAFGPVPSRRLGRSLGINNIPPKVCSYSCAYCQVGRTLKMQVERQNYYEPERIFEEVQQKVGSARMEGEAIDYLTFVPDGEPTLDINLGHTIKMLKALRIRIGIITNGTLIGSPAVQKELMKSNWVSLKIDSTTEKTWHAINRPHRHLQLDTILNGMLEFKKNYKGMLVTETMLAKGVNDGDDTLNGIGRFLSHLRPTIAYVSIPTRPPAEKRIVPPDEQIINRAYQILGKNVDRMEYLIGYEGNAFAFTGDAAEDLLSITAVHPMREDAVRALLQKAGAGWSIVNNLIDQHRLLETLHDGNKFYMRRFPKENRN